MIIIQRHFTIILVSIGLHRASEPADVSVPDTTDAQTTVVTEADTTVPPPLEKGITICIDPGHGFDDPGASTEYLGQWTEADVNLAIGLMLRDELVARGYTVIMTHDTNDIPADASPNEQYLFGLAKRTAYANELLEKRLLFEREEAVQRNAVIAHLQMRMHLNF